MLDSYQSDSFTPAKVLIFVFFSVDILLLIHLFFLLLRFALLLLCFSLLGQLVFKILQVAIGSLMRWICILYYIILAVRKYYIRKV